MDTVGLRWSYEPQGYTVPTIIGNVRYLPDFWLGIGQWGEVKGYLDAKGMRRQYALALGICQCGNEQDMVMLGDIPRESSSLWPIQLHAHGDVLYGVPWRLSTECPLNGPKLQITVNDEAAALLTKGMPFGIPDWARDGLSDARQARFEWGESGAPRR